MKRLEVLKPKRFIRELPQEVIRRRYISIDEDKSIILPNAYEIEIKTPEDYDFKKDKMNQYACQIFMLDALLKNNLINKQEYEHINILLKNKYKIV